MGGWHSGVESMIYTHIGGQTTKGSGLNTCTLKKPFSSEAADKTLKKNAKKTSSGSISK